MPKFLSFREFRRSSGRDLNAVRRLTKVTEVVVEKPVVEKPKKGPESNDATVKTKKSDA